jgi:hypothetical protein
MQLRYALYERTPSGYGWTWRATGLSDKLLDDFIYRIELPTDSNSIRSDQVCGGICKVARVVDGSTQEHVILYRFFDGGSDAGRPNRNVMLTAWTTPTEITLTAGRYGITNVLRGKAFEYVAGTSQQVGIAQPPFLGSLIMDDDCVSAGSPGMPSTSIMEFVDKGCSDEDNDYYLTIKDGDHAVRKKPSAVFHHKEKKRKLAEQQIKVVEPVEIRDAENDCEQPPGGQSSPPRDAEQRERRGIPGLLKAAIFVAVSLMCVIPLAIVGARLMPLFGIQPDPVSAEAREVLRLFANLPADQQQHVLSQLLSESMRSAGRQVSRIPPSDFSHTQDPSHIPAPKPPQQQNNAATTPGTNHTPGQTGQRY